jgi:crotonobetainyl-CoA:carnitine CoA-transferase CaiB-like acyl-CoA transferase
VISCGSAPQARACFTLVGDQATAADPVLDDRDVRRAHADQLEARLIARFADWDAEALFHAGQGLGIPIGLVHSARSLTEDPQLASYGFIRSVTHPEAGSYLDVGSPFRVDGRQPALGPAPALAAHTAEVLTAAGLDADARECLRRQGVIQ